MNRRGQQVVGARWIGRAIQNVRKRVKRVTMVRSVAGIGEAWRDVSFGAVWPGKNADVTPREEASKTFAPGSH